VNLREQEMGNQIPGKDKEYIHTDEAAREPGNATVACDYEQYGNCAQSFDVGAKCR
jgi:hypothetical protein